MQNCPNCNFPINRPPDDIQEWFRCEHCHTPLRVPSELGRILFLVSAFGVLIGGSVIEVYVAHHHWRIFKWFPEGFQFFSYTILLVFYGALIRLVWKTKLGAPKIYDPYSSLNLSDDKTKLRGS